MSALGQKRTLKRLHPMSALPPKADIVQQNGHVGFVPKADLTPSRSVWSGRSECWLLGFLEQRKQDRHNFFRGDPAVQLFLGQDKLLSTKRTDWDHHPSARLELIDQGSWDQIGRRRDGSTRLSNAVLPIWVATCSVCTLIAAINCRLCSSKYSALMNASTESHQP